jgi:hypothetical protein
MKVEIILNWTNSLVPSVIESMKEEHAGYYGKPCGSGKGCGYIPGDLWHDWVTSGGNTLGVRTAPNGNTHIRVSGVRHGIPWRFIPVWAKRRMDRSVHIDDHMHPPGEGHPAVRFKDYKTQEPELAPWETRSNRPTQWPEAALSYILEKES